MTVLNVVVSLTLISVLFAAIYKILPDRDIEWGDVVVGAIVTAVLFTVGKSLISWYIGSSAVASSFGAAGGLIVIGDLGSPIVWGAIVVVQLPFSTAIRPVVISIARKGWSAS